MSKNIFIAFIPARKGSFGIKNKNIIIIKNKKLIEHTILNTFHIKTIDQIFVSSNERKILDMKKFYKNINFIKRKNKLCTSKSLMKEVMVDFIKSIKEKYNLKLTNIILLQPTSPLRNRKDIINAINCFKNKKIKSLVSVSKPLNHPSDMVYSNGKKIIKSKSELNRQQLKKVYVINGSIYIFNANFFLKTKKFFNEKSFLFKMHKKNSIELDENFDLKVLKSFL
jgi:CMP-N,N'-diacetyllegionaminic acid synthase